MIHIDLASPTLREPRAEYDGFSYHVLTRRYLPTPDDLPMMAMVDAIASRRSRREFGPLQDSDLNTLLWIAARTRGSLADPSGARCQTRAAPSAGGLHPIDVIVVDDARSPRAVHLYDPLAHALCGLQIASLQAVEELLKFVDQILPTGNGTVIWFVAQFGRTMSKYVSGESLVWRDAGALLAVFYLVSEAMGLSCCAIGPTGDPQVSRAFDAGDRLRGVGGLVVGSRVPASHGGREGVTQSVE